MVVTSPVTGLSGIPVYVPPEATYTATEIDTRLAAINTQLAAKASQSDLSLTESANLEFEQ